MRAATRALLLDVAISLDRTKTSVKLALATRDVPTNKEDLLRLILSELDDHKDAITEILQGGER